MLATYEPTISTFTTTITKARSSKLPSNNSTTEHQGKEDSRLQRALNLCAKSTTTYSIQSFPSTIKIMHQIY